MEETTNLKLPLLVPNQSQKEITHNEALIIIGNTNQNRWFNYLYDTNYLNELYGENFKVKQVFSTRYKEEKPVDIYLKDLIKLILY